MKVSSSLLFGQDSTTPQQDALKSTLVDVCTICTECKLLYIVASCVAYDPHTIPYTHNLVLGLEARLVREGLCSQQMGILPFSASDERPNEMI